MQLIKPKIELVNPVPYKQMLNTIELAIRNCYQSYDKMKDGSDEAIIRGCIARSHCSPLEFGNVSVHLITDRAVLAQLTRHRIGTSFCVSSQRYVNYSKDKFGNSIGFIEPEGLPDKAYDNWVGACKVAEAAYMVMTKDLGTSPEVARSVLPNCTATSIYMSANIREWRHIFNLRCDSHAQSDIRKLMTNLLKLMYEQYPVFFEDLYEKYVKN
ncbi:MAG: FAD-dependent thymidylate synthase [Cellulosilyticum sp.]|nr:FAD-dependent thymidylate synthase [Cellulosilyticum sp.]